MPTSPDQAAATIEKLDQRRCRCRHRCVSHGSTGTSGLFVGLGGGTCGIVGCHCQRFTDNGELEIIDSLAASAALMYRLWTVLDIGRGNGVDGTLYGADLALRWWLDLWTAPEWSTSGVFKPGEREGIQEQWDAGLVAAPNGHSLLLPHDRITPELVREAVGRWVAASLGDDLVARVTFNGLPTGDAA